MTRLIILIALTVVAVAIAALLQRRRPDPPAAPSYRAPSQLDRDDFVDPATPFLAVVFASNRCSTCPQVWSDLQPLASERMAVQRIDAEDDPADLHRRYRIDGVPTTVLADAGGVVAQVYFGPVAAETLAEATDKLMGG